MSKVAKLVSLIGKLVLCIMLIYSSLTIHISASNVETYGIGLWRVDKSQNWNYGQTTFTSGVNIGMDNNAAVGVAVELQKGYTYTVDWQLYVSDYIGNISTYTQSYLCPYPLVAEMNNVPSIDTVNTIYYENSILHIQVIFNCQEDYGTKYITSLLGKSSTVGLNTTFTAAEYSVSCISDVDGSAIEKLAIEILEQIRDQDKEYYTNAEQYLASIDKHPEEEYDKASADGDDNVSEAKEQLENLIDVSSLSDAISPLITACGYTGTSSVWTMPAITLPAISGVMSETNLTSEQPIDLTAYAAEFIPEEIIELVRYLLTAALIIFAVKEIICIVNEVFKSG